MFASCCLQTNLTWLDLSFNKIPVIEGLDSLVKLQDLSLFSNQISTLQGLSSLKDLNVLSLGKPPQLINRVTTGQIAAVSKQRVVAAFSAKQQQKQQVFTPPAAPAIRAGGSRTGNPKKANKKQRQAEKQAKKEAR